MQAQRMCSKSMQDDGLPLKIEASVRSMAQCMAMGQAAGTAAILSARLGKAPRELAYHHLRDSLLHTGAILETPRAEAKVPIA